MAQYTQKPTGETDEFEEGHQQQRLPPSAISPTIQERELSDSDKTTFMTDTGYGGSTGNSHSSTPATSNRAETGPVNLVETSSEPEDAHKKKGVTEKVKHVITGVKDTITGHKKHELSSPKGTEPATSPNGTGPPISPMGGAPSAEHEKVGCMEKVKDFLTGQKPGHGTAAGCATAGHHATTTSSLPVSVGTGTEYATPSYTAQGKGYSFPQEGLHEAGAPSTGHKPVGFAEILDEQMSRTDDGGVVHGGHLLGDRGKASVYGFQEMGWPQPVHPSHAGRHETSGISHSAGATYTDSHGKVMEGPRDDNVKKEGLMSKMMDKLHLGTNKETHQQ